MLASVNNSLKLCKIYIYFKKSFFFFFNFSEYHEWVFHPYSHSALIPDGTMLT